MNQSLRIRLSVGAQPHGELSCGECRRVTGSHGQFERGNQAPAAGPARVIGCMTRFSARPGTHSAVLGGLMASVPGSMR
jgi:hypothetical protein